MILKHGIMPNLWRLAKESDPLTQLESVESTTVASVIETVNGRITRVETKKSSGNWIPPILLGRFFRFHVRPSSISFRADRRIATNLIDYYHFCHVSCPGYGDLAPMHSRPISFIILIYFYILLDLMKFHFWMKLFAQLMAPITWLETARQFQPKSRLFNLAPASQSETFTIGSVTWPDRRRSKGGKKSNQNYNNNSNCNINRIKKQTKEKWRLM